MQCNVHYITVLCCTALHCTALHCTALHYTVLHHAALHCQLQCSCTTLHCNAIHCTKLQCIALHYIALHCTVLYWIWTVLYCQYSIVFKSHKSSVSFTTIMMISIDLCAFALSPTTQNIKVLVLETDSSMVFVFVWYNGKCSTSLCNLPPLYHTTKNTISLYKEGTPNNSLFRSFEYDIDSIHTWSLCIVNDNTL